MRQMRPMRQMQARQCKSAGVHECKEAEWGLGDRSALVRPILPALDSFRVLARRVVVLVVFGRFGRLARVGADLSGASRIPFLTLAVGIIFGGG